MSVQGEHRPELARDSGPAGPEALAEGRWESWGPCSPLTWRAQWPAQPELEKRLMSSMRKDGHVLQEQAALAPTAVPLPAAAAGSGWGSAQGGQHAEQIASSRKPGLAAVSHIGPQADYMPGILG